MPFNVVLVKALTEKTETGSSCGWKKKIDTCSRYRWNPDLRKGSKDKVAASCSLDFEDFRIQWCLYYFTTYRKNLLGGEQEFYHHSRWDQCEILTTCSPSDGVCSPDRPRERELQANSLDSESLWQPYKSRTTFDEVLWSRLHLHQTHNDANEFLWFGLHTIPISWNSYNEDCECRFPGTSCCFMWTTSSILCLR